MDQPFTNNLHHRNNDENAIFNANFGTNHRTNFEKTNKNTTGLTELHPNQLNSSNKHLKTSWTPFKRPQKPTQQKQVKNKSVLKSTLKPESTQHQNSFRERIDYFNRKSAESNSQFSFSDISVAEFSFADNFCEASSSSSHLFPSKTIEVQPEVQETKDAQEHEEHDISKTSSGYMSNRTFSNSTVSNLTLLNSTVSNSKVSNSTVPNSTVTKPYSTFTKPILKPTIMKGPKLPPTSPEKLIKHRICDHQFITDQFTYLRKREMKFQPRNYLKKQKEITSHVRLVITDWLCEVSFYSTFKNVSDCRNLVIVERFSPLGIEKKWQHP